VQAFRLLVPREKEDSATLALFELGTLGIQVLGEGASLELLCYFSDTDVEGALRAVALELEGTLHPSLVPDVDWVARFREGFRAFDAPPFRIVPAWESGATPSSRVLVVEPGRAFGTGTHESTRLCLGLLGELEGSLGSVLDLGTGSGILAIAASRLGGTPVLALDNDPDALGEAARHARLNGVQLSLVQGSLAEPFAPGARVDTIVANLTAPLLRELLPRLRSLDWGRLIAAGFLVEDLDSVCSLLPQAALTTRTLGEWAALRAEEA
jgi:ribosomal protein L11 methyltransferase